MKRIFVMSLSLLLLAGCASTQIPAYLQKTKPYTKRFYAEFAEARSALMTTLTDLGWSIDEELDPVVYERVESAAGETRQALLVTRTRETPMFLGTRYAKMNVYLRSREQISEVEIRYLTVTATFLKTFSDYRNDAEVNRIVELLEKNLGGKAVQE